MTRLKRWTLSGIALVLIELGQYLEFSQAKDRNHIMGITLVIAGLIGLLDLTRKEDK
jgi:multidrug transporter EmrE-like cation transporter